jgi:hypothetical protein
LYLHTFTLLWCPIRCSVLSFVSSHLHTIVMSDAMFCSVVCIFTHLHYCDVWYNVLFCRLYFHTFTLLWCPIRCSVLRCEDTKHRTEHRIGHHNSVKVWRYKRQNRTSYRTSQQCEGVKIQTTEQNIVFCSVFVSSHLHTIVMSDAMFCSVVCIFTPSHYCDVRYDVLFCRLYLHTLSDIKTVWMCEDTNDRTEHRIGHHNSVKVWR